MSATAAADPVRAQVEQALRQIVESATGVPCRLARRACDRFTTSFGLARSMAELTLGSVFGNAATRRTAPASGPPSALPARADALSATTEIEPADPHDPVGAADTLPLEGYESLAASQVVARLARLTPGELDLIREFEQANRGRRTILGKIEQLLSS